MLSTIRASIVQSSGRDVGPTFLLRTSHKISCPNRQS